MGKDIESQTVFEWFADRMMEVAGEIAVTNVWNSRRDIQQNAIDLMDVLHNGTTEEIIDECAKIGVLAATIADKARFGGI